MNQAAIEELERQIEETRLALDRTLSSLRLELSPRYQLGRAWYSAKDRTRSSLRVGARWAGAHRLSISLVAIAVAGGLYLGATRLLRRTR